MEDTRLLLTTREVAELMGITRQSVWSQCQREVLPAVRLGGHWYVKREAFLRMLELRAGAERRVMDRAELGAYHYRKQQRLYYDRRDR